MAASSFSRCFALLLLILPAGGFAQSGPAGSVRAETIRLMRAGQNASADEVLENQIAKGQGRDARTIAMAEEWLSVATYFFNVREMEQAEAAVRKAVSLAEGLHRQKGADPACYDLYKRLGSTVEIVLRDRTAALAYYELAERAAAANAKVTPGELEQLRARAAKARKDQAGSRAEKKS